VGAGPSGPKGHQDGPNAASHVSVLVQEVCDALAPCFPGLDAPPAGIWVDATAGGAGHTLAMLARTRPQRAILFDRDPHALAIARERLKGAPCPVELIGASFSHVAERLADLMAPDPPRVAAILADLGVSSFQLDTAERGFSMRTDAPLDMRMDPTCGPTLAEVLAEIDVPTLAKILREYGEEPDARRIAEAIVATRPRTTLELAGAATTAMSARQRRRLGRRIHPATRTFMALRIHVNRELDELDRFLEQAPELLGVGGRLAVISFHSLEDRRVKQRMRQLGQVHGLPHHLPVTERELPRPRFSTPRGYARGVTPTDAEIERNPRARSARLRVLERNLPDATSPNEERR
jgi:16S rRNA (cytosine1402-N4)-methyltransferase